jgi:uncharacterized integral membrane protein (TIGR00698 family)
MEKVKETLGKYNKYLFVLLVIVCLMPSVTPALALFLGLLFAFSVGQPFPKFSKKASKYLLQASVVGLGFGMNLYASLQTSKDGMVFTVFSVVAVMLLGVLIGKKMGIDKRTAYLISSGTAICGGSAIAAVGPVIKADDHEMSVSLGTIFILNAIALFIFPMIGHWIGLTQDQFGMWAAIAIHDTSSVVGAGAAYGEKALEVATMVKLTRALWIVPLTFVTMFVFRRKDAKISFPWFILLFVAAMLINTFCGIPQGFSEWIVKAAKQGMTVTLFLIGSGLSAKALKQVGVKPIVQGVGLWIFIAILSLGVIMYM